MVFRNWCSYGPSSLDWNWACLGFGKLLQLYLNSFHKFPSLSKCNSITDHFPLILDYCLLNWGRLKLNWSLMMLPWLAMRCSVCGHYSWPSLVLSVANNRQSLYNVWIFFWITSARCHHIYGHLLYSDSGIKSYKNCHIVSPHILFIFLQKLADILCPFAVARF